MRTSRRLRPALDRLDDRCLPSGLTPAQLTHAYGLDAITFTAPSGATVKGNGAGSTIALIEAYHDATLPGDVQAFDQAYNLPDPPLDVVNLGGGEIEPGVVAGGVAGRGVGARDRPRRDRSLSSRPSRRACQGLQSAVNVARNIPDGRGGLDEPGLPRVDLPRVAGPHDAGRATPGSRSSRPAATAGWPAVPTGRRSRPNVLAVGGTTLSIGGSGNYISEVAWSGSGGGQSQFVNEPGYQRVVPAERAGGVTPDVAFDGDPDTGVEVYQTSPYTGLGSWQVVGGTSLGTPAWAAIIAIADQGRALQGKGSLDGASQTLPTLYALPSSDFHTSPRIGAGQGGR